MLDRLCAELGGSWRGKFHGQIAEVRDGDARLALLKPETWMNESGRSVNAAARFYKLAVEDVLIVHDEIDIPLGDIRTKVGGGLAGHNGLRSVAEHLHSQEFARVRVGIGRPERDDPRPVVDWVLTPFAADVDTDALVDEATRVTLELLRGE